MEIIQKYFWKHSLFDIFGGICWACQGAGWPVGDFHTVRSKELYKDMELDICVKRFTDVRRELGYTQAEFAQLLGVRNTTADIERGRIKLSGKVVSELLKQFKINPMWLFGESDQKHLDTS